MFDISDLFVHFPFFSYDSFITINCRVISFAGEERLKHESKSLKAQNELSLSFA